MNGFRRLPGAARRKGHQTARQPPRASPSGRTGPSPCGRRLRVPGGPGLLLERPPWSASRRRRRASSRWSPLAPPVWSSCWSASSSSPRSAGSEVTGVLEPRRSTGSRSGSSDSSLPDRISSARSPRPESVRHKRAARSQKPVSGPWDRHRRLPRTGPADRSWVAARGSGARRGAQDSGSSARISASSRAAGGNSERSRASRPGRKPSRPAAPARR